MLDKDKSLNVSTACKVYGKVFASMNDEQKQMKKLVLLRLVLKVISRKFLIPHTKYKFLFFALSKRTIDQINFETISETDKISLIFPNCLNWHTLDSYYLTRKSHTWKIVSIFSFVQQ